MKRFKRSLILLSMIFLPLTFLHCTKYKEEAPFFDGLFLEYYGGGKSKLIYNVNVLDNNKFKIIEKDTFFKSSDYDVEMYVDKYGKVYKTNRRKKRKGNFSPIWIPVHEIEIGNTINSRHIAIKKDRWEKWEVLVLKDTAAKAESYYDLNTGFWVGSFAKTLVGTGRIVLVNTNADIPTIE